MSSNPKIQVKDLNSSPDEVLNFEKEKIEIVNLGDLTVARVTLQLGLYFYLQIIARILNRIYFMIKWMLSICSSSSLQHRLDVRRVEGRLFTKLFLQLYFALQAFANNCKYC
jgi:hypothetical protein